MSASRRYPFLHFQAGVNWQKVNPSLLANLNRLGKQQRMVITVTSGFRDYQKQAALYERYKRSGFNIRYIAAKPGTSFHEKGLAVDAVVNGSPISKVFAAGVLKEFGLAAPVKGDPVHVQLAGGPAGAEAPAPRTPVTDGLPIRAGNPASNDTAPTDVVPPVYAPPPTAPPQPAAGAALPGSQDYTIEPRNVQETWQMLAEDPFASPETKRFAQYASGG